MSNLGIGQHLLRVTEILQRALADTHVVLSIQGRATIVALNHQGAWEDYLTGTQIIGRCVHEGRWQYGPGFQDLLAWVEEHWREPIGTRPPAGTVMIRQGFGHWREPQLDPETATRKMIVAAGLYGPTSVGEYATSFAQHGMIETHQLYALKGLPINEEKPLDEYCTLVPYDAILKRYEADSGSRLDEAWRWPRVDHACALEVRTFEDRDDRGHRCTTYTSPLMEHGPEHLAFLLSLVWGYGFQAFGNWHVVPGAVAATLPFRHTRLGESSGTSGIEIIIPGFRTPSRTRPLAASELRELVASYSNLDEGTQRRLEVAMRRLRDSMTRVAGTEDRLIDQCIALEALFLEQGDRRKRNIVASRGSWYYADSLPEREQSRAMLLDAYALRSKIVHGGVLPTLDHQILEDVENLVRASARSMIVLNDRPANWDGAKGCDSILHDRSDTDVRSIKADALSWSVRDQRAIDTALERAWRSFIEALPDPSPDAAQGTVVAGWSLDTLKSYRESGESFVVANPAWLYDAHPKWPREPSDELDERTEYYCEQDVIRHVQAWRNATVAKGVACFEMATDAALYHPKHRERWPHPDTMIRSAVQPGDVRRRER